MRFQPKAIGKSLAWTTGILYAICTIVVIYFPEFALGVAKSWYHGVEIPSVLRVEVTLESFVTGLVTAMLFALVAGYLFAGFVNYFAKK